MKNFLLTWLLLIPMLTQAQNPVSYPVDGVYCTFEAFRNGKPDLVKSQLIKSVQQIEFTIKQWSTTENLFYTDAQGNKQMLGRDSIWGFSESGVVHIFLGKKFHKIHTLGQISYFLESYPVIRNMAPVVTDTKGASYYRLLDMETGELYDYNPESFLLIIENDEALHAEYKAISSAKARKKKLYSFLERYNKAHPFGIRTE
ncbi:MAG: hypothetical protein IPI23_03670 [Bacteroidetes bacterium]|nr:hypothetical protein [Bacteroidota bacterium]MBK7388190.1 hypothetical protein [Bacteroidota bacterium]MBK7968884.1 hypothetical protein [Bacteroidota bacterium]MBK9046544.1 hypothetical protein [Bacteroidota bacterium]MBK9425137.1 hypothetical protein [Bacteroidota bacterium]